MAAPMEERSVVESVRCLMGSVCAGAFCGVEPQVRLFGLKGDLYGKVGRGGCPRAFSSVGND
jgi:hypothetical protein